MGYAEKYNGAAGSVPEFGAIFMANIVTKKECFKHNVFALPSSYAEFVKNVKAGMVLFLFEYQKRQLFGVYQATSDGIHHEGLRAPFSAQVFFTPIWHCSPIFEKEFRDAIRENYFSAYKFNFGLSEDQVHRLLLLFSSRKLNKKVPRHLHTELGDGGSGRNIGLVGDDRLALSQGTYTDLNSDFYFEASRNYQENLSTRAKEAKLLIDGKDIEGDIYLGEQGFLDDGDYLEKRRRLDYDDRLDVTENRLHSNEVRKVVNDRRLSNENRVDKILNPVHSTDYTVGPSDVRTAGYESFKQRNRLYYGDFNMDGGFGQTYASEHYDKSISRSRLPINDDSFTIDDPVQREYDLRDIVKSSVYDGNRLSVDWSLKNRYHMNNNSSSRGASDSINFHNLLHEVGKTTAGIDERINTEHKFASPCDSDHMAVHDDTIPLAGEKLTACSSFSKTKHDLYLFPNKCSPQKGPSRLRVGQSFPSFQSAFGNATIAKSNPYVPELQSVTHKYSSPFAADKSTSLVQKNLPYHGSAGNFYTLAENRSSPYVLEPKNSSRILDVAPEFENKPYLSTRQSTTPHENVVNSKSSVPTDLHTFAPVGYANVHSTFMASNHNQNLEREKEWLHYPSRSSENHFTLDGNLPMPSECTSERDSRQAIDTLKGKDSRFSEEKDFSVSVNYNPGRNLTSNDNMLFRISNSRNLEHKEISKAPRLSDTNVRRSVFTRLTSSQEIKLDEERNYIHFNRLNSYVDASADEVMTMLHQGNNPPQRKQKKFKVPSTHGVNSSDKKQIQTRDEINQSAMENKHKGASLPVEECFDDVPVETRIVDFKRRSETKKSLLGKRTESMTDNKLAACEGEVEIAAKKVLKRRKLVRPIFGKKESVTDVSNNSQNVILSGQNLQKDDKESCDTATSICEPKISNYDIKSFDEYQSADCNIIEKSNSGAQKDKGTPVSVSPELEGNKTSNVGLQTSSSGVVKETTDPKTFGVETGTNGILASDVGATLSTINIGEPTSDGLELSASCGKKFWLSKNRKKIIRTSKTGMGCPQ